jgi:uncharacterized protein (TIGR02246 family)
MASDVAQVKELYDEYLIAMDVGDFERWLALWMDDCLQMAPDTPPRVGTEELRAVYQPAFDLYVYDNLVYSEEVRVRILGDWAYAHSTYTFDMTPKEGGETTSFSGKFLEIVKRQIDGSWKIAIDCHNYNEPLG